jgi:8-oxo-dGTP diphosphatase
MPTEPADETKNEVFNSINLRPDEVIKPPDSEWDHAERFTGLVFKIETLRDLYQLPTYDKVRRACEELCVLIPQLRALQDAMNTSAQFLAAKDGVTIPPDMMKFDLVLPMEWTDDDGGKSHGTMHLPMGAPPFSLVNEFTPYTERGDTGAAPSLTHFVVGLVFRENEELDQEEILLIKKDHPDWQAGRLNGVGGKLASGENALAAMHREFKEEAGAEGLDWQCFARLVGTSYAVHFFRADAPDDLTVRTMTTEEVDWYPLRWVFQCAGENEDVLVDNLDWLIPLARKHTVKAVAAEN